jgi:chorismate mutase / prephenate dehydratase
LKIAILGPQGTYSEQAAYQYVKRLQILPEQIELIYTNVHNSLRFVQNLQADYAVVPVENMIDGLIGSTFDNLIEFQDFVKVCDEIHLPVSHVLAAPANFDWSELERIYSHPSPLNQCQIRLAELFPKADLIPILSTAEAAQNVLRDPFVKSAAICNQDTAIANHMSVFPEEIQDYAFNETRFLVCALKDGEPTGNDRTLIAVRFGSNQPGQLFQIAKSFADAKIDLTFIQSRPYKIKPQEYVLILEFIGHKSTPEVENALKNIELLVRASDGWKKILGSYPKRERDEKAHVFNQ